jgi:energy-coupling factor transporter transmembrane protein EcfT
MGFNPYRKFRARRADYVFVAAAIVAAIALVVWAFLG